MSDLRADTFLADLQRSREEEIQKFVNQPPTETEQKYKKLVADAEKGVMPDSDCSKVFEAMNALLLQVKDGKKSLYQYYTLADVQQCSGDCEAALYANLKHRGFAIRQTDYWEPKRQVTTVKMEVASFAKIQLRVIRPSQRW